MALILDDSLDDSLFNLYCLTTFSVQSVYYMMIFIVFDQTICLALQTVDMAYIFFIQTINMMVISDLGYRKSLRILLF